MRAAVTQLSEHYARDVGIEWRYYPFCGTDFCPPSHPTILNSTLRNGLVDVVVFVYYNEGRASYTDFSCPIGAFEQGLYVGPAAPPTVQESDLNSPDVTFCFLAGFSSIVMVEERYPEAIVFTGNITTPQEAFAMVRDGTNNCTATVEDTIVMSSWIRSNDPRGKLRFLSSMSEPIGWYWAFHKRNDEEEEEEERNAPLDPSPLSSSPPSSSPPSTSGADVSTKILTFATLAYSAASSTVLLVMLFF